MWDGPFLDGDLLVKIWTLWVWSPVSRNSTSDIHWSLSLEDVLAVYLIEETLQRTMMIYEGLKEFYQRNSQPEQSRAERSLVAGFKALVVVAKHPVIAESTVMV